MTTRETRQERIAHVNRLLPLFSPCLRLEERSGRLWLVFDDGRFPAAKAAVLNQSGCSLACRYGDLGMGGTRAGAVAMLVRWVRDESRVPLASWRYWCGPGIRLGGERAAELLAALEASTYGDPAKTGCVFCGAPEIEDWWSVRGDPTGPCCSGWMGCKTRIKEAA